MVLTSSFSYSGTPTSALSASITTPQCSWIINSGASHHMTGMSSLFTLYRVCSGKGKVSITDDAFSSVVVQGDIPATLDLSLTFVLHVPNFALNLLSFNHLTINLNYYVTFFPSYYVLQDMVTKRTIGLGCEKDDLYILDSNPLVATSGIKRNITSSTSDELFTWHC